MSKPPFLGLPDSARAYRLATGRGEFAVLDAGRPGAGTALLLPGFTGSKEDFTALLGPLAEAGFRAVAVDGRGQYESAGPRTEAAYAREELVRDLLAVTAAVRGDDRAARVHLLGHSLGGLIARSAVLHDVAPFASLTLMSSGPAAVSSGQQQRLRMLLEALQGMAMEEVWQAMRQLDPVEAAGTGTPPAVADFLHRRWMAQVPEQLMATARQLIGETDLVGELAVALSGTGSGEAPLPVHVLSGSVDYAWPVPLLDEMAVRLRAVRTVVDGAEHSPNAERPDETARALADFWRQAAGG